MPDMEAEEAFRPHSRTGLTDAVETQTPQLCNHVMLLSESKGRFFVVCNALTWPQSQQNIRLYRSNLNLLARAWK